ncbi:MAG: aminotransferase class III-fold pyridoxal phosphate-dependent enzyme [Nitrososphaerales archaeon]
MPHKIHQTPPGPNAREIVSYINEHCLDTTFTYSLVVKTGYQCYIEDVDGNVYLDFASNIGVSQLGYSHPDIMEVLQKYSKLSALKIAGQDFYSEEHANLAKGILSIVPENFKVFFINSGTEAVENAIKLAYRARGPLIGISCYGAFHGRTLGALTFTYSKPVQKKNFPEFAVKRIRFCTKDEDPSIDDINKILQEQKDIAFIITEVVQGEGGYNIASKKFLENLYRVAKDYDIPLIIDEVQSGMGRTGEWWAWNHYGIRPDIMTTAKGLQVGATLFDMRFDPKEKGTKSSTWGGGHRIDMAVGAKVIEVIKRDKLLNNAKKMGSLLLKRMSEFVGKHGIIDVRGLGLMIAVEFESKERREKVLQESFKDGLILLPAGEKVMRVIPPLIITQKEIDEGIEILEKSLQS